MPISSRSVGAAVSHVELREFTRDFFTFFGAQVEDLSDRRQSLSVLLPTDLAEYFGKAQFSLCFQNPDGLADYDLVAHGSRVFDRMLAYLQQRSALTVQQLPSRFAGGEELLQAVRPLNASVTNLTMQETEQRLFVFNWRITYRADDKREELYTVLLDESGARYAVQGEPGAGDRAIDLETLLADADSLPVQVGEDGQQIPPKLPPVTHLVRLADTARTYAIYHADLRCVAHEAEILPRLYKSLNRLTGYYEQQIQEVYDSHDLDGEKRRTLERDLDRKIAEEIENHRLRVRVLLFSYAILQAPVATAELTLTDGQREATVRVHRNRYTGALHHPTCHACGQEARAVALDRRGHVTCDDCLRQCTSCLDLLCAACGVKACPVCGKDNCDACGRECWACGETACAEHSGRCPTCGDTVCHACQSACDTCGVRQCRSHLRVDAVRDGDGSIHYICPECALRCPGCQQFSSQIGLCSASGQRFCANCLVTCACCGVQLGPGFYHTYAADGLSYCANCLAPCPACQTLTPHSFNCQTCDAACCSTCGCTCAVCLEHFCARHVVRYACGHAICNKDVVACVVDGEAVCAACAALCGNCERACCAIHEARCMQCGGLYCARCVRANGVCETCATILRDGEPVDLLREPCGVDAAVANLAPRFQWLRAGNARYTIYVGRNMLRRGAVVVVDRWADDGDAISTRSLGLLTTLRARLWG